jgi:phage recombination protein Bet
MKELVVQGEVKKKLSLVAKFADKYGVEQDKLLTILKATAFKLPQKSGDAVAEVSNEQMAALLIVADQYGLNPFTKEIYAYPDKGKGIVPIVGVDGWARIMNEHPQFDGVEFKYSDKVTNIDEDAKLCSEWIEAIVWRRDRTRPTVIREYLDECYRPAFEGEGRNGKYKIAGPWQSHTRRMLRHKALIQGVRIAFGFAGLYEEDEAERLAEARIINMPQTMSKAIDILPSVDTSAFEEKISGLNLAKRERELLDEFIRLSAENYRMTPDEVRAQAGQKFEGFMAAYRVWLEKQPKEAETDPWQEKRAGWINIKTAKSLMAYEEENRKEILNAPKWYRDEWEAKWGRITDGQYFVPMNENKPPQSTNDSQDEQSTAPAGENPAKATNGGKELNPEGQEGLPFEGYDPRIIKMAVKSMGVAPESMEAFWQQGKQMTPAQLSNQWADFEAISNDDKDLFKQLIAEVKHWVEQSA